jgi:hypothetical protein
LDLDDCHCGALCLTGTAQPDTGLLKSAEQHSPDEEFLLNGNSEVILWFASANTLLSSSLGDTLLYFTSFQLACHCEESDAFDIGHQSHRGAPYVDV